MISTKKKMLKQFFPYCSFLLWHSYDPLISLPEIAHVEDHLNEFFTYVLNIF